MTLSVSLTISGDALTCSIIIGISKAKENLFRSIDKSSLCSQRNRTSACDRRGDVCQRDPSPSLISLEPVDGSSISEISARMIHSAKIIKDDSRSLRRSFRLCSTHRYSSSLDSPVEKQTTRNDSFSCPRADTLDQRKPSFSSIKSPSCSSRYHPNNAKHGWTIKCHDCRSKKSSRRRYRDWRQRCLC